MTLIEFYAVGTSGVGSASRYQFWPSGPTLRASCGAPGMGWSLAVLWALLLQPTTCTKVVFISTLVTFLAPCWAFFWWVRWAACLTWATLGSVAIAFPEPECLDFIYGCCCCDSTIGLVSVEVWSFYSHPMLLDMLGEGLICDILSLFLWSDPFFDFKMLCCMEKQLCFTYHFLTFSFVLASFYQIFWYIDLTGQ